MQRAVFALVLLVPTMAQAQDYDGVLTGLMVRPEHPVDGTRMEAESDPKPMGALVDWYPGLGGFRLSGGLRVNNNSVDLGANPTQPVNVGGTTYTPTQVGRLSGSVGFNRFAPYLGIGWQGAMMGGRMLIGLDFGALYQGKPDVQLTATGVSPGLADDLARESNAIADKYSGFKLSPVISLSFTYRF
ncbi:MAG: hypothetical protein H7Y60_15225 [Rhodospirillaceae bacterium]|nr:hypothetical protein [Rhodospirillales bacterium]